MAKLIIDVSGKKALGPKYYGDIYRSAADPNYRYIGEKGMMADGIFNPYMRDGYLSPANKAFKQITRDSGTTDFASGTVASIIDATANKWYLLRGSTVLQYPSTNESTDTTSLSTGISGTGSDMENYLINNTRKIFIITTTAIGIYDTTDGVVDKNWLSTPIVSSATVSSGTISAGELTVSDTTGYASSGGLWIGGTQYQYTSIVNGTKFGGVTPTTSTTVGLTVYQGAAGGNVSLTTGNYNKGVKSGLYLYILNGSSVHRIDGTSSGGPTGTFKANILSLPSNLYFYDAVDSGGQLLFVINPSSQNENARNQVPTGQYPLECAVGVWNKTSLGFSQYVVVPGMRQLRNIFVAPNGAVRLFAIDNNRETHLMQFTGATFKTILRLGQDAYPNQYDGLAVGATTTYWYGMDGAMYTYGSANVGDPEILSKFFDFDTLNASQYSSTATLTRAQAICLTQNSSSASAGQRTVQEAIIFGVDVSYSGSKSHVFRYLPYTTRTVDSVAAATNTGNAYTLVQLLPLFSKINYIRSVHLPSTDTGTDAIATLKTYYNQTSTADGTFTVTKSEGHKGYKYLPIGKEGIYALQIEIEWNSSQNVGSNDYCPMYFEVDYEPTSKLI